MRLPYSRGSFPDDQWIQYSDPRYIVSRSKVVEMGNALSGFGRYSGPATLLPASLADGPKHGYALTKDVEQFSNVHLAPGTLYTALDRLVELGLAEPLEAEGRRRPYRITAHGASALREHLEVQRRVADVGLGRLATAWGSA